MRLGRLPNLSFYLRNGATVKYHFFSWNPGWPPVAIWKITITRNYLVTFRLTNQRNTFLPCIRGCSIYFRRSNCYEKVKYHKNFKTNVLALDTVLKILTSKTIIGLQKYTFENKTQPHQDTKLFKFSAVDKPKVMGHPADHPWWKTGSPI